MLRLGVGWISQNQTFGVSGSRFYRPDIIGIRVITLL